MTDLNTLKKDELTNILVEEYGYKKSDLKNDKGNVLTNGALKELIIKERKGNESVEKDFGNLSHVEEEVDKEPSFDMFTMPTQEPTTRRFKNDELIPVMNGGYGALHHRSQTTGQVWRFKHFGQIDRMPYSEIVTIRNVSPKAFEEGWLVILNEDIQKDFNLENKLVLTRENITEVFKLKIDRIEEIIDNLPEAMKISLFAKARELYQEGKLDSRSLIDFLEKKFGISLEDNSPIS